MKGVYKIFQEAQAIPTHRLIFCLSDWTTKRLLVGPSLPLMRTEGFSAGCRSGSSTDHPCGQQGWGLWPQGQRRWLCCHKLLSQARARLTLSPAQPHSGQADPQHIPLFPRGPSVSHWLPRQRWLRVGGLQSCQGHCSQQHLWGARSCTQSNPASPTGHPTQPQPATGVGRALQQHLEPPHCHSQPQGKEHSRQLRDSSKLREWKPLQSWKFIKRKR